MQNIGFDKMDGDVAVGVSGTVVLQLESRAVDRQRLVVREDLGRHGARGQRRKIEVPVLDALHGRKMFPGVFVSQDGRTFAVDPFVAVGVVEVPMRVDEVPDRIVAETCERLQHARLRRRDAGIDKELSVRSGKDADVAA